MPALPEAVLLAVALLALWSARDAVIDARGGLAGDDTPLDDAILQALV